MKADDQLACREHESYQTGQAAVQITLIYQRHSRQVKLTKGNLFASHLELNVPTTK